MFSVDLDQPQSVVRLHFAEHVDAAEAKACLEVLRQRLAQVRPGFCLITDLTGLEGMDLACEPFLDEAMERVKEAGVRRVIRVVPDPGKDIGFGIMSLFHYGQNVRIRTCTSAAEAEDLLRQERKGLA